MSGICAILLQTTQSRFQLTSIRKGERLWNLDYETSFYVLDVLSKELGILELVQRAGDLS